jgi:hypothetical protein
MKNEKGALQTEQDAGSDSSFADSKSNGSLDVHGLQFESHRSLSSANYM